MSKPTQFVAKLPPAFLDATREIMPAALSMDDFIAACNQPLRPQPAGKHAKDQRRRLP
ncbi:hypothetical protein ACVWWB_000620 [Ewingella americana]